MKKKYHLLGFTFLTVFSTLAQQPEKPNPDVQEIIIVFKTHFDNGYTDLAESVLNNYSTTMMEQALTTLEKSRTLPREKQFVWTMPSWPLIKILQRCSPELRPKLEAAIRDGWFAFHGLPFTFETEAGDPEALVRSLTFSADLARRFNLPLPRDAKLTDVPSHSWFLPTLLCHAGIKILHIGCNPVSSSPEVPLMFWWQGPDGSKLLTIYWGKNYGTSLVPDESWKFKTWLAIVHTGDNQGPPSPEDVDKVLSQAHKLAPNAQVRIGRISDFYDSLMKENPDLPIVKGDMPDTWIHGYMSMPREMKSVRALQKDIYSLEMLNTVLNRWTDKTESVEPFTAVATEGALLWDEHTFGMAMSHGHAGVWCFGDEFVRARAAGTFRLLEDSWKEKSDRVYQADKVLGPAFNRELRRLAAAVKIKGERIVVYNSLPWSRSGPVAVQAHTAFTALQDPETGELVPMGNKGNVLQFIARDVPASGYKTWIPVSASAPAIAGLLTANEKANSIENDFFKISIDPAKGALKSLIDKKAGTEMVDANSEFGFGQFLYERFSRKESDRYIDAYLKLKLTWGPVEFGRPNLDDTPYARFCGGRAVVRYGADSISATATLDFPRASGNPYSYSICCTLYKGLPFIELNWFINGKAADSWPEAGWLAFPFNVQNPQFKLGRLGAVIDPIKDIVRGSAVDYYLINNGVAVHNSNGSGYAISTPDAPGISLDRPGLYRYSQDFTPKLPTVFVNLFNNQWSTNFTEWIEGSWSAKLYLWSFQKYNNESALISPNEEFRSPLKAVLLSGDAGALAPSKAGIRLSRKGVLVTAFAPNPFGEGTLLRLWEQSGDCGVCKVTLPDGVTYAKAVPVNLRGERRGREIPITDNTFTVQAAAYQPASFQLVR